MPKKQAAMPCEISDIARIRDDLSSPDESVRARAVRDVCPCRLGWNAFEQCMQIVHQLQKDASPLVRAAAQHVIEESYELGGSSLPTTPQQFKNDMIAIRRQQRWRPEEELAAPRKREKAWRARSH